jgi:hypothetical protein
MGLIYGVCTLVSSVAAFETGRAAVQKASIEETAKSFFYGICSIGWVPGGAFTGMAVCVLHAWSLRSCYSREYYFLDLIFKVGALFRVVPLFVVGFIVEPVVRVISNFNTPLSQETKTSEKDPRDLYYVTPS